MKQIYVATSKIAGFGVMIGEDTKREELICHIKGEIKFKINKDKQDALANPDWVGIAENQWIDPEKPYKFLNHSCNPSAGIRGERALIALRDLREGEEVTIDYSTIEGDERWEMPCSCGSENCRKIVKSIQYLPEKAYKEYLPNIPDYFQKLYVESRKEKELSDE